MSMIRDTTATDAGNAAGRGTPAAAGSGAARTGGVFVNSDAWNFWHTKDDPMDADSLRRDIDFYIAGGGVAALLYNMNFQRTFFESRVWTPYWRDLSLADDGELLLRGRPIPSLPGQSLQTAESYKEMFQSVMRMRRNCPDYMRVRYAYCRSRGVELWHSMRMNDVHWTSPGLEERPQHGDFWREHKERLARAWYRRPWFAEWNWSNYALDYGQPEVFDYSLALVKEYLLDYEADGIELDWLRGLPVFRPGHDQRNTPVLTRFMRAVRRLADEAALKWGHGIRIAARAPTRVQEALDVGMDVLRWAQEGLVDVVIPSPHSVRTEQDCQVQLWRRALPPAVVLAPAIDMYVASGWMCRGTLATDCAFASAYYHDGADTLYIYNHFPLFARQTAPEAAYPEMAQFFALAADRRQVDAAARRHVVTWRETVVEGAQAESPYPAVLAAGSAGALRVNMGGAVAGRAARFVIGATVPLQVEIWVNGVACGHAVETVQAPGRIPVAAHTPLWYVGVELPGGTLHDGWNVIDLHNVGEQNVQRGDFVWSEVALAAAAARDAAPARPSRVVCRDGAFWIDGRQVRLLAGTMHYFRIPRAYWRERMLEARALGLNAIETYLCWNLHERREGEFDFSGNLDVEAYFRLAHELGLYVVARPGPYICSEWDNGGIPAWLMLRPGIRFRRSNQPYEAAVANYMRVVIPKIRALDADHGGPVVAVQIENEYGSYAADKDHLAFLRDLYRAAGVKLPLFTADSCEYYPGEETSHLSQLTFSGGTLPGTPAALNFGKESARCLAFRQRVRPDDLPLCAEFWCGWFEIWGGPRETRGVEATSRELETMLEAGCSIIFYALCGGTMFYMTGGANGGGPCRKDYRPNTTSYDFDAILTEAGERTPKFHAYRELIARHTGVTPPERRPLPRPAGFAGRAPLTGSTPLAAVLDAVAAKRVRGTSPLSFEELGTDFGYVFYRTRVPAPIADPVTAPFALLGVRDRANVLVDGRPLCTCYRNDASHVTPDVTVGPQGVELAVLVENMGRIHFGNMVGCDTKGICQDITFSHQILTGWEMWTLPLDNPDGRFAFGPADAALQAPAFHLVEFGVAAPADTYLKFPGTKGMTWINGHPLGRYWNIGPGDTLYVSGCYLRPGVNRLVIFETDALGADTVEFTASRV